MSVDIYTAEEIKAFILAIDIKLNSGLKMSELSTGQSEQEFQLDIPGLTAQRDYWMTLYKSVTDQDGGIVSLLGEGFQHGGY